MIDRRNGALRAGRRGGGYRGVTTYLLDTASAGTFTRNAITFAQVSAAQNESRAADVRAVEDLGDGFGPMLSIERQWSQLDPSPRTQTTGWVGPGTSSTWTADQAAGPDGTTSADRANVASGGYGKGLNDSVVVVSGSPYTASWWWRAVSGTSDAQATFFSATTNGTAKRLTDIGTTWQRSSATMTPLDTGASFFLPEGRSLPSLSPASIALAQDLYVDQHNITLGRYARRFTTVIGTVAPDDLSYAEGEWDVRLATSKWTIPIVTKWASTEVVSSDVRWILSFGGGNHGVRFRHDGTGVLVEALVGGVVEASSGYLTFAVTDQLLVTVDPSTGTITVNGVAGATSGAITFPTTGAVRLGGIYGAAAGSGEEVDARMGRPFLGSGGEGSDLPVIVAYLGDSYTVATTYRAQIQSDSTSAGYRLRSLGAYSAGTYPADRHSGVNGNTIAQMDARVTADVAPYRPEIVVIPSMTNSLPVRTAAEMADDLDALLTSVEAVEGVRRIVVALTPPRTSYDAQIAEFHALQPGVVASHPKAVLVDAALVSGDLSGDGVHLTVAGYQKLGSALWTDGLLPYLDGTDS